MITVNFLLIEIISIKNNFIDACIVINYGIITFSFIYNFSCESPLNLYKSIEKYADY